MKVTFKSTCASLVLLFSLYLVINPVQLQAQNCPGLGSITLNVISDPAPTISGPVQLCPGATGTLSVNEPFSEYLWSTGSTTNTTDITSPATYTVTVTNATGCTGSATVTVGLAPPLTPNITQLPYACNGEVTLDAGPFGGTYTWSNGGGNNQTAIFNTPGVYSVTVTDAEGCTGTDDYTVIIPAPPAVDITGNLSFCDGSSTLLNATPGFAQYAWTGGGTGPTLTVNSPGNYTVTVTDGFGCTATASATLQVLIFTPPIITGGAPLCPGTTVTLDASGPNYISYNWSNGPSTPSIGVTSAGTYTVTVTSGNGCTGTASETVIPATPPITSITGNFVLCNGNPATLTATGNFPSYNWSNNETTPSITVNQPGIFTVTVTSNQGCTGTASTLVLTGTPPVVNVSGPIEICPDGSAILSAQPSGLDAYFWSNGESGQAISINLPGTYTVTATDADGCTGTDSYSILLATPPQPAINGPASICSGTAASLSVSGGFSAYNWSTGQNTASILASNPGNYAVTVTGANGCTGTDDFTLVVIPSPAPVINADPYACDGQITLIADVGFASYAWSNGQSGNSITVSTDGIYFLTVTANNGCTGTAIYNVNIPITPVVNISGDDAICSNSTGTLSATAGFTNYTWNTFENTQTISISSAGNYSVTATDIYGCTATDVFPVQVFPSPAPVIAGPNLICDGGSATFSLPGNFIFYNWSTGQSQPSITVSDAGIYSVTVTDINGCTGSASKSLSISSSLEPQIVEEPYNCDGQIGLDAGVGFDTYLWNTGETTTTISASANGLYTVTVTDNTGCTGTSEIDVFIPDPPVVGITGPDTICQNTTGTLEATPGLGSYVWSNSFVGQTIEVSQPGTYAVTATDFFGCTVIAEFVLQVNPAPITTIQGPTEICFNSIDTLSASGNFSAYQWNTGETAPSILVANTGTYSVTVTNTFGCTGTASQMIEILSQLEPEIDTQPYACNGEIFLEASAGFTTYLWNTGDSTATISTNISGEYSVTVTDAPGCTGMDTLSVSIPDPPSVSISGATVFCENSNTVLGATPGFVAYLWSTGEATSDISVTASGSYEVTVTDLLGCTATASALATAQALPSPMITGPSAICTNSTGILSVAGNFTAYFWSTADTVSTIEVNTAGDYTVTVTDALGCTGIASQTVTEVTQLEPQIDALPYACDGQISIEASPGFATYQWNTGDSTVTISTNISGEYSVTVTDATGCTGMDTLSVSIPDPPSVTISGSTNFCENSNTVLGATPGFAAYLWSTGETTSDISVTASGSYEVTVSDILGCTATASALATAQALPTPIIAGPNAICTNSTGILSVAGNFTTYSWSTADTVSTIEVNTAGDYTVTVTDALGCTGSVSQTVTVVTQLEPQIDALPYACDGQISIEASPGFATYQWNTGDSTATISANISGDYSVTVTDATGCTGVDTLSVSIPDPPSVTISGSTNFCENSNTVLGATPGFAAYLWSTGETTSDISVTASGSYEVTVTDMLGCTATASALATAQALPTPIITGPNAICTNSTGVLSVAGNFTTYSWSTADTVSTIEVNTAGDYTVTVTDALGCTGSVSQTVTVVTQLEPQLDALPYDCDGQISLEASAGFVSYLWSTGDTTATISANISGDYSVTVTDATGCTGVDTISVSVPELPSVAISGATNFCENTNTQLGATPGFAAYLWSTGETTPDISISASGNYEVTVTDMLGCTATASALATAQALPVPAITGPAALCLGDNAVLTASGGFSEYYWSDAQNTSSITVTNAGTYSVTVTDALGCTGTAETLVTAASPDTTFMQLFTCNSANVGLDIQLFQGIAGCDSVVITQTSFSGMVLSGNAAVASNYNSYAVACSGGTDGVAEVTSINGAGPYEYLWSNGTNLPTANNLSAGVYTVTFTDADGCSGTASVSLNEPPPILPVIDASDPDCQNLGIIEVAQINGGAGPYTAYLGQGVVMSSGTQPVNFINLIEGTYEVEVVDANGCNIVETVVLQPVNIIEEFVSDTFEINKGDTVLLNAGAGITIQPAVITWTAPTPLSCSTCLNPTIAPLNNTLVELEVESLGGCRATGRFLIIVKHGGLVYIPNVIKPGSTDNYAFTLYGDESLIKIRQLQVYDRWGNQMAVFENIVPNDPEQGWDGQFRGQDMMPGVYVWWAEVEYSDGTTEIIKGDVTLVR